MKIYIAGPMTGYADHNFSAFAEATYELRDRGYEVVSPHEISIRVAKLDAAVLTREEITVELAKHPWHGYLRADLIALLGCDLVALLPGWEKSKGANLEVSTADAVAIPVILLQTLIEEHDDGTVLATLAAQGDG